MNDLMRQVLASLLRMSVRDPENFRLESILIAIRTHIALYHQEGNAEGAQVFERLQIFVARARNFKELELYLGEDFTKYGINTSDETSIVNRSRKNPTRLR